MIVLMLHRLLIFITIVLNFFLDYYYSTWNRICCDRRTHAKYIYEIQVPWFKALCNQTVTVLMISRKPKKIGNKSNAMQEWQNKKTQGYKAFSQNQKSDYVKWIEMARAAAVQSSGCPLKVLKQSANNFFSGDVIPGRCGQLQSARRRFLFCAKFQNLTTNFFAAVLSILPLCQRSVSLVFTQISEPCYELTKATDTFIYSRSPRFRLRTSILTLTLAMYPFSISLYEHVPLKFLMTKRLRKVTKIYLPI